MTTEQLKLLRSLDDGLELDLRATTPEIRSMVYFLSDNLLVEYVDYKDDQIGEGSICVAITELGKIKLAESDADEQQKQTDRVRYAITTSIAVAALILAIISILIQQF